jgi:hypothetical protein
VSITNYFHADGYLAEARFKHDVEKLLGQYEQLESRTGEEAKKFRWGRGRGPGQGLAGWALGLWVAAGLPQGCRWGAAWPPWLGGRRLSGARSSACAAPARGSCDERRPAAWRCERLLPAARR